MRDAIEFTFGAADGRDGLTFGCPRDHGTREHDGISTDATTILGASMICISACGDGVGSNVLAHVTGTDVWCVAAIRDTSVASAGEIAQDAFDCRDMWRAGIMHEACALIDCEAAVSTGEAGEIHTGTDALLVVADDLRIALMKGGAVVG